MGSSRVYATLLAYFTLLLVTGGFNLHASELNKPYPETITVLKLLYASEVKAGFRYKVYAQTAEQEGHDNIAHMLTAMAASEDVHARSFKAILLSLGVEPQQVDVDSINRSRTKDNLRYATEVELGEIDRDYPAYLKRIKAEGHSEAIKQIAYAWQAEKQHRDLIKEIESGTGMFFSMLLNYFRSNPSHYYVNDVCGSTVTELPKHNCPICHNPLTTFREIPKP